MNNKYILVCTTFFIIAVVITRFTFYLSHFAKGGDCFRFFSLRASRAAAHNSVLFPAGWPCAGRPASQEDDFHLALSGSSRLLLWGKQLPCWKSLGGRDLSVACDPQPRRKRILPAITWVGEIHPQLSLERSIACERPWWRGLSLPAPGFLTHENQKTIHVCDVKLLSLGEICYAVIANWYTSTTQYTAQASFRWVTLWALWGTGWPWPPLGSLLSDSLAQVHLSVLSWRLAESFGALIIEVLPFTCLFPGPRAWRMESRPYCYVFFLLPNWWGWCVTKVSRRQENMEKSWRLWLKDLREVMGKTLQKYQWLVVRRASLMSQW